MVANYSETSPSTVMRNERGSGKYLQFRLSSVLWLVVVVASVVGWMADRRLLQSRFADQVERTQRVEQSLQQAEKELHEKDKLIRAIKRHYPNVPLPAELP